MLREQRKKILIVDDNDSHRRLLDAELSEAGYKVLHAARFSDSDRVSVLEDTELVTAEQVVWSHYVHAAIIDLSLDIDNVDDLSGLRVLSAIVACDEGSRCCLLSQYLTVEITVDAWKKRGADMVFEMDSEHVIANVVGWCKEATTSASARLITLASTRLAYDAIVKDLPIGDVVNALSTGGAEEIKSALIESVRPYFPFDRRRRSAKIEPIALPSGDGGVIHRNVLKVRLWSRYLGAAIEVFVGAEEACQAYVWSLETGGRRREVDFITYSYSTFDRTHVVVQALSDVRLLDDRLGFQ